jgi:hypothetical protein
VGARHITQSKKEGDKLPIIVKPPLMPKLPISQLHFRRAAQFNEGVMRLRRLFDLNYGGLMNARQQSVMIWEKAW